jgi:hypothetical protein
MALAQTSSGSDGTVSHQPSNVGSEVNAENRFISREGFFYAESTHAPPAALIFFSANFEKYFAFTITGTVI